MKLDAFGAIFWMVCGAILICIALYTLMGWWFLTLLCGLWLFAAGWQS